MSHCLIFTMQLYIKVSEDLPSPSQPPSSSASLGREDTPQGSAAVELTDPHLPALSQYWLAALKDKAYLSLPAEFASQLPPSGGAFYSVDVMDDIRPYYEANWSSLLHAAAIWLQERGFAELEHEGAKKPATVGLPQPLLSMSGGKRRPVSPPAASDQRCDYFHLVLGLATQSLCLPATLEHAHVISDCLRALQRVLRTGVAQEVLGADARISIEILSMLHRLLLTSQLPSSHIMALNIAVTVSDILRETVKKDVPSSLDPTCDDSEESLPPSAEFSKELDATVPVRMEYELVPGRSCAYALLEVASCCLLRLVPGLRPAEGSKPHLSSRASAADSAHQQLPRKEDLVVMSLCLKILATSGSLCSPLATPSLLPSVLHMFLSTLSYVSTLPPKVSELLPGLSTVALQFLGQFLATLPVSHDQVGAELVDMLQSALVSVLGCGQFDGLGAGVGESELVMNDGTRLLLAAIFLRMATPPGRSICPAPSKLFDVCAALFERCLHSSDTQVSVATLFSSLGTFEQKKNSGHTDASE